MTEKPCIRCCVVKPLEEFYRHPKMRDGHLNKCRRCVKLYAANYQRIKSQDPVWAEKERKRLVEKMTRLGRATRSRRPERHRARILLHLAVKRGAIMKSNHCEKCLREMPQRKIHGHHKDYTKPLDVEWLCPQCHVEAHRKDRGWLSREELIQAG